MPSDHLTWNLAQLLAWVCLRDEAAVDRAKAEPGSQVSRIETDMGPRLSVGDAENQIRIRIAGGRLACTAVHDGHRIPIRGDEFMTVDFLYSSGGAQDRTSDETWHDVAFPRSVVLCLWPAEGQAQFREADNVRPAAAPQPRKNQGGRPTKWNWDQFWIEVALWAAKNDLVDEDSRPNLTNHIVNWFATNNGGETPPDSSIRERIAKLFKEVEAKGL
jgi:hypothetical protein